MKFLKKFSCHMYWVLECSARENRRFLDDSSAWELFLLYFLPSRVEWMEDWQGLSTQQTGQTPRRVFGRNSNLMQHLIAFWISNKHSIMSRASTSSSRPLTLTEELEKLEQSITLTLQGLFSHSTYTNKYLTVQQKSTTTSVARTGLLRPAFCL
jgi:hypothetical protein